MATNTNVAATQLLPQAGADNSGLKEGFIESVAKAAQNDTVTVTNASEILHVLATTDADGVADPVTVSGNVITLTGATATPASMRILYR